MKILAYNAVSIVCVSCAMFSLHEGFDGWGWFLVVAVMFSHTARSEQ